MTRPIIPYVNFFDGQEITETDLDVEQTAWHDSLANNTDFLAGSGIEQEFASQRILFDTDDVPASIQSLLLNQDFDGEPIYPTDTFGLTVYEQPSDVSSGNQLEVEITGASLDGAPVSKIYIFGKTFGGDFIQEVLTFEENGSQITNRYFTEIVAIMSQNFRGNQNTTIDGIKSSNVGGRLRIMEPLPMTLARDVIMAEQSSEPNMDYINFKPATPSKTLDILLDEIADSASLNADDLAINVTATTTRSLDANTSTGIIIGQKFLATTNNIQKVSLLLSVEENTLALPGEEFDWSGDIVVGIRPLQTTTSCPTDTLPNTSIEFDPEPSPIAEVSFDKEELAELGVNLTDEPTIVDFIFTQSLLANPSVEPSIEPGKYYILTIRRAGNISTGNIVLQEAANTDSDLEDLDQKRLSVFSQNKWTDIPESDLWFKIYTDAVRITDGTAFDSGVQITSPRIKKNETTGLYESYIEGNHSLLDVSQTASNYVMVQKSNTYSDSIPHPSTGNLVFTRIEDTPDVSVVSIDTLTTLIEAGSEPIVIGSATDTNPKDNSDITGTTRFPGLLRTNTFTILQPTSDVILNNLIGSVLTPNTSEPEFKYRIIKKEVFYDAYGDVNADGSIDLNDVARAQALDGYSKSLEAGSLSSSAQRNAIVYGTVDMEEIIRADVTNNGYINIFDPQAIQQNIALGTAFQAGSNLTRVVLTVENIVDPLTTTPDMIGSDPSFNQVPFSAIEYNIKFVPLWYPQNVVITDLRRFVPKTFTEISASDLTADTPTGGKNTSFIPGDLLLGGDILTIDGSTYPIDIEVNNIIIDLPEGSTQGEIDIFSNFIKNQMYFYDGTLVKSGALEANQVKVATSIQSISKDIGGDDFQSVDGYAAIDETIAVLYTQSSGILRIRANNVRNIATRPELRTKIVLTVYLKKAGFKNTETSVTSNQVQELLTVV